MANEHTEILYGPRAEIHTIKTGKIKHTLRYVGNNHYVTTPSSEKHDVQRTHYSLDDALDHLRKQGHQISKTDLHPNNKTPIVKESNMKDFKDFVKTTYAGLMEVEGLNESTSHRAEIEKHFGKVKSHENSHYYSAGHVGPASHVYHTESGHDIEHISPKHSGNGMHYVEVTKGNHMGFAEHHNFADAVKEAKDSMIDQS